MSRIRLWKRAFSALFLFLYTSCTPCCPKWEYGCSIARNPCHSSGRIYLCASNHCSGLEIELVRTLCDLRMYINVYGLEIPPDCHDPSVSQVYVSFKDHSYNFQAQRFTGGQRLLIPDATRDEIIDYLVCEQPVFIRVGRYEADIYPGHFFEVFNRLMGTTL